MRAVADRENGSAVCFRCVWGRVTEPLERFLGPQAAWSDGRAHAWLTLCLVARDILAAGARTVLGTRD